MSEKNLIKNVGSGENFGDFVLDRSYVCCFVMGMKPRKDSLWSQFVRVQLWGIWVHILHGGVRVRVSMVTNSSLMDCRLSHSFSFFG